MFRHTAPLLALLLIACSDGDSVRVRPGPPTPDAAGSDGAATPDATADPNSAAQDAVPRDPRIVAVGDVHGDLVATRAALRLAGAIDESDAWIGGDLIVVQLGDQLDRGSDEPEILALFEALRVEAAAAGGAFYPLLGNHEVMNVQLDMRYVTSEGWVDFADTPYDESDPVLAPFAPFQRGRVAAFRPGGPYATILSEHLVVLELEGNIFVHGGVLPEYAEDGLDRINEETSAWMMGEGPDPYDRRRRGSPVSSRHYSDETGSAECALLEQALALLGAERMIVAHTVQDEGINSACDGRVWRVDVGLADYYGGSPEVLEIIGDSVRPILSAQ